MYYYCCYYLLGCSWGEPISRTSGKANWGFDKVFDLNVKGLFYLTRECIPMLERDAATDDPGRVINIGSVAGMIPQVRLVDNENESVSLFPIQLLYYAMRLLFPCYYRRFLTRSALPQSNWSKKIKITFAW